MNSGQGQITFLLQAWSQGDVSALGKATSLIYSELRKLARFHMSGEKPGHTIQPTALVNEAYIRFAGMKGNNWPGRSSFLAAASQIMRRILVDHARKKRCYKRGLGREELPIEEVMEFQGTTSPLEDLLAFDEAMGRLESIDARKAKAIDLSLFAGCSISEISNALGIGLATVHRDLEFARTWLAREIGAIKHDDHERTLARD